MAERDLGNRSVSVKDVAAAAEVSLGTVSNVLNRPERVSSATRERVLAAMARLGFVRNESARQLRAGSSRTLAYVLLDSGNPFFTDVAEGIDLAAEQAGLTLVLCNSRQLAHRERAHLEMLEQRRVQGILITPVDPDSPDLLQVAQRGTPVVMVDRTPTSPTLCSVAVDDVRGGRMAVEHLIDRGHTAVAYVGGPDRIGQVQERWEGARQAWEHAGLPEQDLVWIETGELTAAAGTGAGARLAGMPSDRRPTAAFCANDLVALGLLQHAVSTGISVPHELAIVGYDDIDFAAASAVPLTSVRQPRQELGRTAASLILEEACDPTHRHRQMQFDPELVARASTLS